jgi:hypothetical protein
LLVSREIAAAAYARDALVAARPLRLFGERHATRLAAAEAECAALEAQHAELYTAHGGVYDVLHDGRTVLRETFMPVDV